MKEKPMTIREEIAQARAGVRNIMSIYGENPYLDETVEHLNRAEETLRRFIRRGAVKGAG